MGIKQSVTRAALTAAMSYISDDPEKNLPKLLSFIESISFRKNQADVLHQIFSDPENVWYKYIMDLWHDVDNDVLKATFRNFVLNASLFGYQEQEKTRRSTAAISHGRSCLIPPQPAICTVPAAGRRNTATS